MPNELVLDWKSFEAIYKGKRVRLTRREWELLVFLDKHRDEFLPTERIGLAVWGLGSDWDADNVKLYIHYLRKKLGRDVIENRHGFGYRIRGYD